MKNIKLIVTLVVVLAAVFIGAWVVQDNALKTGLVLLGFQLAELPVGLWVLVFFFCGVVVGVALCYPANFALKRQSRQLVKKLQKLDVELSLARNESAAD